MLGSFLAPLARTTGGLVGQAWSRTGGLVASVAHTATAVVTAPLRAVSAKSVDPRGHDPTRQLRHALDLLRGRARAVWVGDGRLHAQLSLALCSEEAGSARLETSLLAHRGVQWVAVNRFTNRVVVAYDTAEVSAEELVAVVDEVDEAWQDTEEEELPEHPADLAPLLRQLVSLGVDAASLTVAIAGRFSRLPALPAGLTTTVGLLENAPRLRRVFEARLGTATADLTLSILSALVQGLGQGPLGPAIDILHRAGTITEISARRASWERREPELCAEPTAAQSQPVPLDPRPVGIPEGPIETYAERAWFASLAAAGITLPATRNLERASAALAAGMPKAARLGREAFAIHLGRVLAHRGILAFDPGVLRLLDRVDVVVVERHLLRPKDVRLIGEIVPTGHLNHNQIRERVAELFDPEEPDATRRRGEWALEPFDDASVEAGPALQRRVRELQRRSAGVLALSRREKLVALVETRHEQHALHDGMETAVQDAGLALAFAASDSDEVATGEGEWVLPDGEMLVASIQRLQRQGHVVCVVASRNHAALAAADVGIGIRRPGDPPPWTAHLLCRDDLTDALIVIEACAAAREVSIRSVRLAATGAGVGGFFVLRGMGATTRPVLVAVHVASLAALTNGAWTANSLGRRPRPSVVERVPWHVMDAERVLERLDTSRAGLSTWEAMRRRVLPGRTRPAPLVLVEAVTEELNTPLTPVLLAGAGLSVVVGSVADAAMITSVVVLNGLLGGLQRFRTERAIGELGRTESRQVTVIRDGEATVVDAAELVPGDIVRLEAGEGVPADCRILEGTGLEVDESKLTGESGTVAKSPKPSLAAAVAERSSMLYEGTYLAAGSATAVVVAVGVATEARRAFFMGEKQVESGVEARLNSLTSLTIPAALLSGAGVVGAGLLQGQPLSTTARGGVGLVAAAVPEGLPLLATTAQLASAQRLSARGALVRDPRSIEALGRVDLLCADKTGTLTQGRLELSRVSDGSVDEALDKLSAPRRRVLAAGLRATPAERSSRRNSGWASGETVETLPHPTDQVIISGARAAGVRIDEGAEGWERHDELPFEPARSYHATVGLAERISIPGGGAPHHDPSDEPGGRGSAERTLLSVKGAPEVVLPRCTHRLQDGGTRRLDAAAHRRLDEQVDRLARKGYRVLAVAERELPAGTEPSDEQVKELAFTGFLAISDPVRPAAAAAISELRQAGVEVAMITGDHPSTAEGIAAELELLNGQDIATGAQIDALGDDELEALVDGARVFARVTPAHKVRIVEAFQRLGRIVAMTGDGANDAPAIRLADAGIAVGERGTSAARDAADLVVFDDRIETIVDAIVEGRAMWSSVREAVAILVGGNLGEIVFALAASLLTGQPPLNARQLLLVNLLTDVAPAIAIALRPPIPRSAEDLLHEGPEASLGEALNRAILWRGVTTAAGASAAWGIARVTGTPGRARTVGLVGLVLTQLGQTLAVGGRSPAVLTASLGSTALLATVVQTPGVSQLLGCRPLGPLGWATGIGAATVATGASVLVPRLASASSGIVPRLASGVGSLSSSLRRGLPAALVQPQLAE